MFMGDHAQSRNNRLRFLSDMEHKDGCLLGTACTGDVGHGLCWVHSVDKVKV